MLTNTEIGPYCKVLTIKLKISLKVQYVHFSDI